MPRAAIGDLKHLSPSTCFPDSMDISNLLNWRDFSFCEEDYRLTKYAAELVNSVTNLAYGMKTSSRRIPVHGS